MSSEVIIKSLTHIRRLFLYERGGTQHINMVHGLLSAKQSSCCSRIIHGDDAADRTGASSGSWRSPWTPAASPLLILFLPPNTPAPLQPFLGFRPVIPDMSWMLIIRREYMPLVPPLWRITGHFICSWAARTARKSLLKLRLFLMVPL